MMQKCYCELHSKNFLTTKNSLIGVIFLDNKVSSYQLKQEQVARHIEIYVMRINCQVVRRLIYDQCCGIAENCDGILNLNLLMFFFLSSTTYFLVREVWVFSEKYATSKIGLIGLTVATIYIPSTILELCIIFRYHMMLLHYFLNWPHIQDNSYEWYMVH